MSLHSRTENKPETRNQKRGRNVTTTKGKTVFTDDQVVLIRTLRGDHHNPNMSYAKITEVLEREHGLKVGMNTAQFAGWGMTYGHIDGPKGWKPYEVYKNWNCIQKAQARTERRQARQAEAKARRESTKVTAKRPVKRVVVEPLKDELGKLTTAGRAKVLELAAKGIKQAAIAAEVGVNPSTVCRVIKAGQ
jgi:hypothetical protein